MTVTQRAVVVGFALLITVPVVQRQGDASPPTPAESQRLGWQAAEAFDDLARDVFDRVNDERAARGLPPLVWDDDLTRLARGWSERMIAVAYEHSPASHRDQPRFVGTAENIAYGYRTSAEVHVGWMEPHGHRANILDPNLDTLAVGIVCRNDGILWATQIFGITEPSPPQPTVDASVEPITAATAGSTAPTTISRSSRCRSRDLSTAWHQPRSCRGNPSSSRSTAYSPTGTAAASPRGMRMTGATNRGSRPRFTVLDRYSRQYGQALNTAFQLTNWSQSASSGRSSPTSR